MDPVSFTALMQFGVAKALDAGVRLIKVWRETGGSGVAMTPEGSEFALGEREGGRFSLPFGSGSGVTPVSFDAEFVPADDWARVCLHADQPVLVVIDHQTDPSVETAMAVVALGAPLGGQLVPGRYTLGAFVFLDEDFEDWEDLDGGAMVEFDVDPGEPPFHLEIPIEADPESASLQFHATGELDAGEEAGVSVVLQEGITYQAYVDPADPDADFDLYVFDENGNAVAVDEEADSDALCSITPAWTGPFSIVVRCHEGSSPYDLLVFPDIE